MFTDKNKVRYVLNHYPHTRNDDMELYRVIVLEFYRQNYKKTSSGLPCITFEDMLEVIPMSSVIRWRAFFQNDMGQFTPTNEAVKIKRQRKRKAIMQELGY